LKLVSTKHYNPYRSSLSEGAEPYAISLDTLKVENYTGMNVIVVKYILRFQARLKMTELVWAGFFETTRNIIADGSRGVW
jgi:hypothetical protein